MLTPIKFKDRRSDQQTILKMHAKAIVKISGKKLPRLYNLPYDIHTILQKN